MLQGRRQFILGSATLLAAGAAGAAEQAGEKATRDMPMRRRALALTKDECLEVIRRTDHAVLATADAAGIPYAVAVTPFLHEGRLYFHGVGAGMGRKAANMAANPNVSMCFVGLGRSNDAALTVDFVSVVAEGPVRVLEDPQEKAAMMKLLLARHTPGQDAEKAVGSRLKKIEAGVNIYEVTPENLTGKATDRAYKEYFGRERAKDGR